MPQGSYLGSSQTMLVLRNVPSTVRMNQLMIRPLALTDEFSNWEYGVFEPVTPQTTSASSANYNHQPNSM